VLQVSASIAESDISDIRLGDIATIQVSSTGKQFEGRFIQINPSSQFTGGQYIVKISVPDVAKKDFYPGMIANVYIPLKKEPQLTNDAVLIPASAIFTRDELTGIYTISTTNTALLRWVRLGKTYGDRVEVVAGLSKNERFISSSDSKLFNGAPVREISVPPGMTADLQ